MDFDHVGIAVKHIVSYRSEILHPMGVIEMSTIYEDFDSKIAFCTTSNGVRLELIEPMNENSPVWNVVKKNEGGLSHICFKSVDFDKDIQLSCLRMIREPKEAKAFNWKRVAFFLTLSNEVIEIVEN